MRSVVALPLSCLAIACSPSASDNAADAATNAVVATVPPLSPASPAPQSNATPAISPAKPGTSLPPASTEFRYVGTWAAKPELCRSGAWTFAQRHLATAGEVSCDFDDVETVPGGYDIAATCYAEAPAAKDRITLRFAESAKAMMVEAKSFQPIGLIYCGT
ncbi:hypothetical protein LZK98_11050 [Sphingomonas cannabina]|uniref:hypothetical protein n=1 Tax=Sphingomonas cannabina TaxID=2899123 RepID=UPI001F4395FC|nr:hypothetical protein [Sphingomonas cannabina]UIJ43628.1 hypothetical protein LZK98_11050 [Sphingomonas cannabina]